MGKSLDKAREFEATSRREAYKFWLGFCEKIVLLMLATIIIPWSIGQSEISREIRLWWVLFCAGLVAGIIVVSIKLYKLSLNSKGGEL